MSTAFAVYEVRRSAPGLRPGYEKRFEEGPPSDWTAGVPTWVAVYLSPDGTRVPFEVATCEAFEIIRTPQAATEHDFEYAINALIELLGRLDPRKTCDTVSVADKVLRALDSMARESEQEKRVALRILATPWDSLWDDTSARCLAATLLAHCECSDGEAEDALTALLAYATDHGGTDHYTCCERPVHDAAQAALSTIRGEGLS